jgi:hypothetical protein
MRRAENFGLSGEVIEYFLGGNFSEYEVMSDVLLKVKLLLVKEHRSASGLMLTTLECN